MVAGIRQQNCRACVWSDDTEIKLHNVDRLENNGYFGCAIDKANGEGRASLASTAIVQRKRVLDPRIAMAQRQGFSIQSHMVYGASVHDSVVKWAP